MMKIALPSSFGAEASAAATDCPFVIDERALNCDLEPGDVVNGHNTGIETCFPKGKSVHLVLFGFTRPHGYACCLDRNGTWWVVHPEALIRA